MWKPDSNCPIWTRHSLLYDVSLCKQAACGLGVLYVKAEKCLSGDDFDPCKLKSRSAFTTIMHEVKLICALSRFDASQGTAFKVRLCEN